MIKLTKFLREAWSSPVFLMACVFASTASVGGFIVAVALFCMDCYTDYKESQDDE